MQIRLGETLDISFRLLFSVAQQCILFYASTFSELNREVGGRLVLVSAIAYWLVAIYLVLRRKGHFAQGDRAFLMLGYLAVFVITAFLNSLIHPG